MDYINPIPDSNFEVLAALEYNESMFNLLNENPEITEFTLHILEN